MRSGEYVGPFETYPLETPDLPTRFGEFREGEGRRFVVLWGELVGFEAVFSLLGRLGDALDGFVGELLRYLPVLGRRGVEDEVLLGKLGVTIPLRLVGVVFFPDE